MFEFSTLGAIVGFIGGGVVLFDRYYKGRPIASLSMTDEEGKEAHLYKDKKYNCL